MRGAGGRGEKVGGSGYRWGEWKRSWEQLFRWSVLGVEKEWVVEEGGRVVLDGLTCGMGSNGTGRGREGGNRMDWRRIKKNEAVWGWRYDRSSCAG